MSDRWQYTATQHKGGEVVEYTIIEEEEPLTWQDILARWQRDTAFNVFFSRILRQSHFLAFRWETSPLSESTLNKPFTFVLVNAPYLNVPADRQTFASYFSKGLGRGEGIVEFQNLGADARLIAPVPITGYEDYAHFKQFLLTAQSEQIANLWPCLASAVYKALKEGSVWVNTAGDGVAWLHIRLDKRPKYYQYRAYLKP